MVWPYYSRDQIEIEALKICWCRHTASMVCLSPLLGSRFFPTDSSAQKRIICQSVLHQGNNPHSPISARIQRESYRDLSGASHKISPRAESSIAQLTLDDADPSRKS